MKRTFAFVDGQNLFRSAKEAFGYTYPNYDIRILAETVCTQRGWQLSKVCFCTGVPSVSDDPYWHHFWAAKLAQMGREGVSTFRRELRYRNQTVKLANGTTTTTLVGQEKGIDVRLALDIMALGHRRVYDVALIFSQDQDLSEVADEIRLLAVNQGRWIKIASAFPVSPTTRNKRGINGTDWIQIDRGMYDACIDHRDYRPKTTP
ncbi:MAG TPA: NYN domain-containing protein [Opitutaceae bacterium]|nr:NYN domain-containing protein [Opitutaceae bacterium]